MPHVRGTLRLRWPVARLAARPGAQDAGPGGGGSQLFYEAGLRLPGEIDSL